MIAIEELSRCASYTVLRFITNQLANQGTEHKKLLKKKKEAKLLLKKNPQNSETMKADLC